MQTFFSTALEYAPLVSAAGVLSVGAAGALIAYRQWRTANTRLQLDLYQRRYPIFAAAENLFASSYRSTNGTREAWEGLDACIAEAGFIFDDRVRDYLREVSKAGFEVVDAKEDEIHSTVFVEGLIPPRTEKAIAALAALRPRLVPTFRPYLLLEERRNRTKPANRKRRL